MRKLIACCALLMLAAACGEDSDTAQEPLKCRTQAGTFTADYAVKSSSCQGNPPAITPRDVTFEEDDCGEAQSTTNGTTSDGCAYSEVVVVTGDDDGYAGTDTVNIDCSAQGAGTCSISYNIHFTKR